MRNCSILADRLLERHRLANRCNPPDQIYVSRKLMSGAPLGGLERAGGSIRELGGSNDGSGFFRKRSAGRTRKRVGRVGIMWMSQ